MTLAGAHVVKARGGGWVGVRAGLQQRLARVQDAVGSVVGGVQAATAEQLRRSTRQQLAAAAAVALGAVGLAVALAWRGRAAQERPLTQAVATTTVAGARGSRQQPQGEAAAAPLQARAVEQLLKSWQVRPPLHRARLPDCGAHAAGTRRGIAVNAAAVHARLTRARRRSRPRRWALGTPAARCPTCWPSPCSPTCATRWPSSAPRGGTCATSCTASRCARAPCSRLRPTPCFSSALAALLLLCKKERAVRVACGRGGAQIKEIDQGPSVPGGRAVVRATLDESAALYDVDGHQADSYKSTYDAEYELAQVRLQI